MDEYQEISYTSVENQTASDVSPSSSTRIKKQKLDLQNKTDKCDAVKKKQPLRKKVEQVHVNSWQQKDIPNSNELNEWKYPEAVRDMHDSSVTLFELFITDKIVNLISKETNSCAAQKGNLSFKLDPKEFKSSIAVLLLSGYIPYPRRSMCWEMRDDSQNSIVCDLFIPKKQIFGCFTVH